ncbi:MAG TPA: aminotransferase class IV [Phenylobacterium sp.]|nr:aminotransferase class IV [Phenylobacterium sp.]
MTGPRGVPFDDRGLLLGEGLFETVLARDGELDHLAAHLDRLAAGCAVLGLPAPDRAAAEAVLLRALAPLGAARAAVRLTLTAGSGGRGLDRPQAPAPRLFATAAPSPRPQGPARLAVAAVRRNAGSPASRLKTLSYLDNILAREEARAAGADEALMLNTRDEVACAAAGNIFWIEDEVLFTPALDCGVLAGIARARVVDAARRLGVEVCEVRAPLSAVSGAQAVFLTNSLVGVRPVVGLGGSAPHALVERLGSVFG